MQYWRGLCLGNWRFVEFSSTTIVGQLPKLFILTHLGFLAHLSCFPSHGQTHRTCCFLFYFSENQKFRLTLECGHTVFLQQVLSESRSAGWAEKHSAVSYACRLSTSNLPFVYWSAGAQIGDMLKNTRLRTPLMPSNQLRHIYSGRDFIYVIKKVILCFKRRYEKLTN